MKRSAAIFAPLGLALTLVGCVAGGDDERASTPSAPTTPEARSTLTSTPTPVPTPVATVVADYTVRGFDAQQVWDLCQSGVVADNDWIEKEYPGTTTFQPLTADGVRDAGDTGHVIVQAPSALLYSGKPSAVWICEFSGDPSAPTLDYAIMADR